MSRPKLGQLLLSGNLCDRNALMRAWEQKALFGDRLGTNLLAGNHIDEKTLALTLGHQHGTRAAYGEVLRVDPRVVRGLSRVIARRHAVVPHHRDGNDIYLLVKDPTDEEARRDVEAAFRANVIPVVVCEARMWTLLHEHYGVEMGLRPIDLDSPLVAVRRLEKEDEEQQRAGATAAEELVSEAEFNDLYMRKDAPPPQAFDDLPNTIGSEIEPGSPEDRRQPHAGSALRSGPIPGFDDAQAELLDLTSSMADGAAPAEPAVPQAAPRPPATTPPVDQWLPLPAAAPAAEGLVDILVDARPLEDVRHPSFNLDDAERNDTPLSFEEATTALEAVRGRSEIARIVIRFALTRFKRAALLTVHPNNLLGWEGIGDGLSTARLSTFRLARAEDSVFSVVAQSKAHYIGPLQRWRGNGAWLKHTGRQIPKTVAVLPVLVRGEVVNLFYGDNGHQENVDTEVGELLILMQKISSSYEALLGRIAP